MPDLPPQGQEPQGAPQPQPQGQQQGQESAAAQMASSASDGLMGLLQLAQQAGQKDTVQMLTQVINGFQAAMEHLSQSPDQGQPQPEQGPGGPMPQGASQGSEPYPYQG